MNNIPRSSVGLRHFLICAAVLTLLGCNADTSSSFLPNSRQITAHPQSSTPTIVEYDLPLDFQTNIGITAGPDGNVWLTGHVPAFDNGEMAKVTTQGVITVYPIAGSGLTFDAKPAGSAGVVFTFNLAGAPLDTGLGIISSSGAYNLGYTQPGHVFDNITTCDGTVYATEAETSVTLAAIESINVHTSPFTVTPLLTLPTGTTVGFITVGRNGDLWFEQGNAIAKLTRAGAYKKYPIPSGRSPNYMTFGPDGNVWFGETTADGGTPIARITPAGTVSEFPISGCCIAGYLAAGPDGGVWFAFTNNQNPGGYIGEINPLGKIRRFVIPDASPDSVAVGPDGNIWFEAAPLRTGVLSVVGKLVLR